MKGTKLFYHQTIHDLSARHRSVHPAALLQTLLLIGRSKENIDLVIESRRRSKFTSNQGLHV
jgi:hypothetical protein